MKAERGIKMGKIFETDSQEMSLVSRLLYQFIEEKYRPLLDESSDLMCITDREGKFIYVNKKLADSLAYTKKELLGMHLRDIVAQESLASFQEGLKEFLKKGKTTLPGFILKTKYRGRLIGEMHSMAFHDNNGKYCGAKSVFRDQTQLLEIENLEKKYESMMEDGIGSVDSVILVLDPCFRVKWASASIQEYFGLDRSVVIGEDMRELFKQKIGPLVLDNELFLKNLTAAFEAERNIEGFEYEFRHPLREMQRIVMEHHSYPILHGDLSGGRIEIFRDVTARKKSEETLEYYYKKIHAIMEYAVEGMVELRTDNTIEFVNRSFLGMLGYSEMEMLNRDFSDFIAADERSKLASIKLIRKAREITFLKKDHAPMYGLVSSIPLVFGTRLPHALCFIANITETKLAAEKLKDANLTLRALNNALLDLSLRDVRTGVYNYRYLHERLAEEIKRAKRYLRPFSLILMDIDFFKVVNDSYGHGFGDVVLKEFSELLKRTVRETDIVIRSGGEEFVVFLSDTDTMGAWVAAQKIIKALERTPIGDEKRKVTMTVSVGICSYPEAGLNEAAALLDAADEAMYESKRLGRNQITVYKKGSAAEKAMHAGEAFWSSLDALKERLDNIATRNEASMLESLLSVVREIDRRLGYAPGHIERVLAGVEKLGRAFSFSAAEAQDVRRVALLRDLGLIAVPQEVLQKTGSLSEEQFRLIRRHPLQSVEALRPLSFLRPLQKNILSHHERYDGKGYPEGLKREDIPLAARIVSVIEAFEALASARPYRPVPYAPEKALRIIQEEAGRQFDPLVVDHFVKSFA